MIMDWGEVRWSLEVRRSCGRNGEWDIMEAENGGMPQRKGRVLNTRLLMRVQAGGQSGFYKVEPGINHSTTKPSQISHQRRAANWVVVKLLRDWRVVRRGPIKRGVNLFIR
jgi:hypothetical protein